MATNKFLMRGSLKTLFKPHNAKDGNSNAPTEDTDDSEENAGDVEYVPVWEGLPKEAWSKKNVHAPKHHDATVRVGFCTKYNLMQRKELKLMCRKKKIFLTQVLLPILIVACFNLRALLLPIKIESSDFTPFVLDPVEMKHCDGTILFAPPFNESTMMLKLANFLNNETTTSNLTFEEHPDISQIGQSIRNSCGTVHFTGDEVLDTSAGTKNVSNQTKYLWPKNVNYQIRLRAIEWSLVDNSTQVSTFNAEPSKWATDRIYPKHLVVGPRNKHDNEGGDPGYASEGFLYLQHRIDLALITMVYQQETGKDFKNEYLLQLQRFPFPAFGSTNMVYLIQFELPFVLLCAFLAQVLISTYLVVKEKETGAKIFSHSFGVSSFSQLLPFMVKSMIQYSLVNLVITFLLRSKWYEDGLNHVGLINETDFSLIFMLLEVVTFNTCALSCLIAVFFANAKHAAYTAGFYWIFLNMSFLYFSLRNFILNPLPVQYLSSLFAQSGLRRALQYISLSETNVGGTHWEDLFETKFDVGHVLVMLFVGGVISILLAVYIENIYPVSDANRHVAALPKLYFFHCWWWKGQLPPDNSDAPEENEATPLPEYFEREPKYMNAEYQIKGVSKCYVGDVGVFNLTMNFYEGEISVILGESGSGKSTLHHVMSGITSPTRGSILLNHINVCDKPGYLKYNLGSCPQENFLYDYLTVEEHITLFALLKGFHSMGDALDECERLIRALRLKSVCTHRASELTYSQKRLVHVAIAFCAGSKVVVLDEPTTNMDASSKRIVWGFLQKEKKKRAIIVLTSDTEEVNFISDRLSILVGGEVQSRGSLNFIKAKFGGGYHLKIFKGDRFKVFDVTNFVQSSIPNSCTNDETDDFISYYLPGEYSFKFPELLDHFETRTTTYDIENVAIMYVTMDEVFKKVGKMNESDAKIDFKRRRSLDAEPPEINENVTMNVQKEASVCNFCRQFVYLMLKHFRITARRKLWLFLSVS